MFQIGMISVDSFYWAFARLHLLSSSIQLLIENQILASHRILSWPRIFIQQIKSFFYCCCCCVLYAWCLSDRLCVASFIRFVSFYSMDEMNDATLLSRLLAGFVFFHYCVLWVVFCCCLHYFFAVLLLNVQSINRHSRFKNSTALKKDK